MLPVLLAQTVGGIGGLAIVAVVLIGLAAILIAVAKAFNAPPLLVQCLWIVFGVIIAIVAIKVILVVAGIA